ncbi:btk-binding protein-related [Anaeramoeba flamelloides]|uniref:Btk-binding protein-related n=1 Tax=Anaeramoeba flamelloides TaxID=1746091 RepID=A0AAV7ZBI4_9EUKA|nr:btk-binding protein-related [Anaeramoeba flamelloides]
MINQQLIVCGNNENGQLFLPQKSYPKVSKTTLQFTSTDFIRIISPAYTKTLTVVGRSTIKVFGSQIKKIYLANEQIISVRSGKDHWLILCSSGNVYGLGRSPIGQLGIIKNLIFDDAYQIPFFEENDLRVTQIEASTNSSYFLDSNGNMYSTGSNQKGKNFPSNIHFLSKQRVFFASRQLATGNRKPKSSPTLVSENVKKISSGVYSDHIFIVTNDRHFYCCGDNSNGQLGLGDLRSRSSLTELKRFQGMEVGQICCGGTCTALIHDHSVYSTGKLSFHKKKTSGDYSEFELLNGLETKRVQYIAAGSVHFIAKTFDNEVYCWGGNVCQQTSSSYPKKLDIGKVTEKNIIDLFCGPFQTIISISDETSQTSIISDFNLLYERKELTDCEIKGIKAHSLLLKLRTKESDLHKIKLILEKYQPEKIKSFLYWVYTERIQDVDFLSMILKKFNRNVHHKYLLKDLIELNKQEETKDFGIIVENKVIKIHRLVLQARSDMFRGMFLSLQDITQNVSDYTGKTVNAMEVFFKFCYTDQIVESEIDTDSIESLSDVTEYYQLDPNSHFERKLRNVISRKKY